MTNELRSARWVLASASPRRFALLQQIGINPVVIPADVVEVNGSDDPIKTASNNALLKCNNVVEKDENGIVLAADTIVVHEGCILGKPRNEAEAVSMLRQLSGVTHKVITAFAISCDEKKIIDHEITNVTMRSLQDDEIQWYVSTGEPMDKAGAYGIQGGAASFVKRVEGCYFNVVGLPLAKVLSTVSKMFSSV